MSALTTGEVMEALKRLREELEHQAAGLRGRLDRARGSGVAVAHEVAALAGRARLIKVLALLERYAPEMVQREAEEAAGERKVRVTLTPDEARELYPPYLDPPTATARSAWDKLDAALKSLDPPEMLESSDREDEG